jgi:hypothetical protein
MMIRNGRAGLCSETGYYGRRKHDVCKGLTQDRTWLSFPSLPSRSHHVAHSGRIVKTNARRELLGDPPKTHEGVHPARVVVFLFWARVGGESQAPVPDIAFPNLSSLYLFPIPLAFLFPSLLPFPLPCLLPCSFLLLLVMLRPMGLSFW